MRMHVARLGLYLAAVAAVGVLELGVDPRPWVAGLCAAAVAVLASPVALHALEGVAQARRWGRWADDDVRAAWGLPAPAAVYPPPVPPLRPRAVEHGHRPATVADLEPAGVAAGELERALPHLRVGGDGGDGGRTAAGGLVGARAGHGRHRRTPLSGQLAR